MSVQRIPGRRSDPGRGVYLVDREADRPTSAGLALVTTVRHTRALVTESVGLAAWTQRSPVAQWQSVGPQPTRCASAYAVRSL